MFLLQTGFGIIVSIVGITALLRVAKISLALINGVFDFVESLIRR